ncbi:MAG: indolepyruvate ferredoxin oxidoreductase [Desulfarculus sp.]|jgi:indolepyruvate ferredoxin oxidoreductase beta subunit|nr:MAG: indolepyruvate ferredoxin oxidoreductase [Desulfarculus sp.]
MSGFSDPYNLMVCGVGGQGNILISRMIGRILVDKGFRVTIGETFGAAQRGGSVFSSMRISRKRYYGPLVPKGKASLVLSLEPLETLRLLAEYGNQDVLTITNTHPIQPVGVLARRLDYPEQDRLNAAIMELSRRAWFVDVTEMALSLGAPIVANIILLGCLLGAGVLPIEPGDVEKEMRETFPPNKLELNIKALKAGIEAV